MQRLRVAVLEHAQRHGRHFDLLIETPGPDAATGPLWAARMPAPSPLRVGRRAVSLVALPPHRRRYLRHQGDIGGGRGEVRRVDQGFATAARWTPACLDVTLWLARIDARLRLARLGDRWLGVVDAIPRAAIHRTGGSAFS